jgi:hypothetical protein
MPHTRGRSTGPRAAEGLARSRRAQQKLVWELLQQSLELLNRMQAG